MGEAMTEKTWRLSDPGMDLFERAGLAGLYMTLRAATEAGEDLSPLQWNDTDLKVDSVTVRWAGPARPAFVRLMQWAWQVREGVLYFPAIHDEHATWWNRVDMHNGLMSTYFQNPQVQPTLEAITRVVQIDDEKQLRYSYKPPAERVRDINPKNNRPHRRPVPTRCVYPHRITETALFDANQSFHSEQIRLSSWIYPGAASRFTKEQSWEGAADLVLLLMLVPTICMFLRLPKSKVKIQGAVKWIDNWALVVPDVRDLQEFDGLRRQLLLNPDFVDAASLGDAGLKFLAEYTSGGARKNLRAGCRVVAMGKVNYYPNQSIRKAVLDVSDRLNSVRRYRILNQIFPNHFQRRKVETTATDTAQPKKSKGKKKKDPPPDVSQGNGWFKLPTGRGRIADNLVNGRPWYRDLFVPMPWDEEELDNFRKYLKTRDDRSYSRETTWFHALCMQRSRLMRLIADDNMWDTEAEKVFATVIWETLDSLYAQERAAVERGGSATYEKRCDRLNGEFYRSLMQAKTPRLLREVLAGLFAKAGRQKSIHDFTPAVWRLIDRSEFWQKGRDLALVAFASYRRKAVREGKETEIDSTIQGA